MKTYWSKPFLITVEFEWFIGLGIGYDRVFKGFIILLPFCTIEIEKVKLLTPNPHESI